MLMRRSWVIVLLAVHAMITCPGRGVAAKRPATTRRPASPSLATQAAAAAPNSGRLPGEFEPQSGLLLAVGRSKFSAQEVHLSIIRSVAGRLRILMLVNSLSERRTIIEILKREGLARHVSVIVVSHDSPWIRDYGPLFLVDRRPRGIVLDPLYTNADRPVDDTVPTRLANLFLASASQVPVLLEGGNLLSNGRGLALTTTELLAQNQRRGTSEGRLRWLLNRHLALQTVVMLEPLHGESTGHVDNFAVFTGEDTVVIGAYDPAVDARNAELLDRNARRLRELRLQDGRPLKVVRISMPANQDDLWRTHTNTIFANDVVLVPTYRDVPQPPQDAALDTFRALLPGWQVVPIDSTNLIAQDGSLHCISKNIPSSAGWLTSLAGDRLSVPAR